MTGSGEIRAGRAYVELGVKNQLTAGLKHAQREIKELGSHIRNAGLELAGLGTAAVVGLFEASKAFAEAGEQLLHMSVRTGLSVEALSELRIAAEQSGAGMEGLEKGLRLMNRNIGEASAGSGTAAAKLERLGLSVDALMKLSPDERFSAVADAISRIQDSSQRAAAAMSIFGRAGTQLLPLIEDGAAGLARFRQISRDLGISMSADTARSATELAHAMKTLSIVTGAVWKSLGAAVSGPVMGAVQWMTQAAASVLRFVRANRDLVIIAMEVGAALVAAGGLLAGFGITLSLVGTAIGGFFSVAKLASAALGAMGGIITALVSPMGVFIAALGAATVGFFTLTDAGGKALDWLMNVFFDFAVDAKKSIGGVTAALASGDISKAAEILWLNLKIAWVRGSAAIESIWIATRDFLGETWNNVLAAANLVWTSMRSGWADTMAFVTTAWNSVQGWLTNQWLELGNWWDKLGNKIQGVLDSEFDATKANLEADSRLAEAQKMNDSDQAAAMSRVEAEHAATLSKIQSESDARAAAIEDKSRAEKEARAKEAADSVTAADKELSDLRARLNQSINDARAGGAKRPEGYAPRAGVAGESDSLLGKIKETISVAGTFNASAAFGLGAGGGAMERVARSTEESARYQRSIVELMGDLVDATEGGDTWQ